MKKHNFYFIGECAIILALLVLIGALIKGNERQAIGEDNVTAVVEVNEKQPRESEFLEKLLEEQEKVIATEESVSINSVSNNMTEIENAATEDKVKIVVFGDSIWNAGRGENGISEQIMEQLNVEIYNCSIGGTSAAVDGENTRLDIWDSKSFNGMVYIANGLIEPEELIAEDKACEVIRDVNFEEIDYAIVSYGLNDYFMDIPVYPSEYYDMNSYVGALRHGVRKLQKQYPNIEVILTSPTYCEWFKGERQYELGTYTENARSVANELELHFLDMYHALGSNPDEKTECLSDGVHLNDEGLTLYANWVIEYLKGLGIKEK